MLNNETGYLQAIYKNIFASIPFQRLIQDRDPKATIPLPDEKLPFDYVQKHLDRDGTTTILRSSQKDAAQHYADVAEPDLEILVYFPDFVSDDPENTHQNFIRITNKKSFIPDSDISVCIKAKQYPKLQELGLTHDDALSAKLIQCVGEYRLAVLMDQELYDMRTTSFDIKQKICSHFFKQVRLLQTLEISHGKDWSRVSDALDQYEAQLRTEQSALVGKLAHSKPKEHLWIVQANIDLIARHLKNIQKYQQRYQTFQHQGVLDSNRTTDFVEGLFYDCANDIVDTSLYCNELITAAGGGKTATAFAFLQPLFNLFSLKFFRGRLHNKLCTAKKVLARELFDQSKLILPEHQGNYFKKDKPLTEQIITLSSTDMHKRSRGEQQKFIFGISYLLNQITEEYVIENYNPSKTKQKVLARPEYDAFNPQAKFDIVHSAGWSRILRRKVNREQNKVGRLYHNIVARVDRARLNLWKITLADLSDLIASAWSAITRTGRAGYYALHLALRRLVKDLLAPSIENELQPTLSKHGYRNTTMQSPVTVYVSDTEVKRLYEVYTHQMSEYEKTRYSLGTAGNHTFKRYAITDKEQEVALLCQLRRLNPATDAPFATPKYRLTPYHPNDVFSSIASGIEGFFYLFDDVFEKNPCICLVASLLYVAGGIAAIKPEYIQSLGAKLNLTQFTDFFVKWNIATAKAMSRSEFSNFVSAGFSMWQETLLTLQTLAQGGDSLAGECAEYFKEHFPRVLGIFGGAYAVGYSISHLIKVPGVSAWLASDKGNIEQIEEFFTGLKLGAIGYETLESEFGRNSIVGAFIAGFLALIILPFRCLLSIPNAGFTYLYNKIAHNPRDWWYIQRPWKEASNQLNIGGLILFDFTARMAAVVSVVLRAICRVLFEFIFSLLITSIKIIFLTTPPGHYLTSTLLQFKFFCHRLTHQFISGPLKQQYRVFRNAIARTRDELSLEYPIEDYLKLCDSSVEEQRVKRDNQALKQLRTQAPLHKTADNGASHYSSENTSPSASTTTNSVIDDDDNDDTTSIGAPFTLFSRSQSRQPLAATTAAKKQAVTTQQSILNGELTP